MSTTTAFDHTVVPLFADTTPTTVSAVLLRRFDVLRGLSLFAGACDYDLLRLGETCLLRRFEHGRTVLRGGSGDVCVILVEGRATTTMPRGIASGEFALAIFEAGDLVSEGCWASPGPTEPGETVALEHALVVFLPKRPLNLFLARNPVVALHFLEAVATKLHRVVDQAAQNSCLDVGDRLYRKLVELCASRGRRVAGGIAIDHGLYQSDLAAGISASREAVNRQLAAWRDRGFVEPGRRFILVKDPVGLSQAVSASARAVWSPPALAEKTSRSSR